MQWQTKYKILPKAAAKCKQSTKLSNKKMPFFWCRSRKFHHCDRSSTENSGKSKSSKLEITTIFVKKLQNTKMSIVQNSTTVYKLNNKADIKSHLQHQQKILWETKNVITTIRTNSIGLQLQFAVCSCFWPSKSCPTNIWFRVDLYTNAITVRTAKQQKQLELLYCQS